MIQFAWHLPHIEAALSHAGGTHTALDVLEQVVVGAMQFWSGRQSAIVTEIIKHPRKNVLHFFLAGGEGEELRAMRGDIEIWAKQEHGCTAATLTGRRGWARSWMVEEGYRDGGLVHMTKELASEQDDNHKHRG
jgi:hypothetical protein